MVSNMEVIYIIIAMIIFQLFNYTYFWYGSKPSVVGNRTAEVPFTGDVFLFLRDKVWDRMSHHATDAYLCQMC